VKTAAAGVDPVDDVVVGDGRGAGVLTRFEAKGRHGVSEVFLLFDGRFTKGRNGHFLFGVGIGLRGGLGRGCAGRTGLRREIASS
jgi:hypothetical protein